MAPKKSASKASSSSGSSGSKAAAGSGSSSHRSGRKADDEEPGNGARAGKAPRHSRAPLPAAAGSIQRPSNEMRFEDIFPDDALTAPPAARSAASSSGKRKATASDSVPSGSQSSKRKRAESGAEDQDTLGQPGRPNTAKVKASTSRAPRATLGEESEDGFVFTRIADSAAATTSESGPSRSKRSESKLTTKQTGPREAENSRSGTTSRPPLADVADGETPVIRRNQAFRAAMPGTPGSSRFQDSHEGSSSQDGRRKRSEAGSSLRQGVGLGQPSSGHRGRSTKSRRSSLDIKSSHRRSSLRDGRTPAYPHRDVPAKELYRHVNAQSGPLPRLKAIFGWISERNVEEGAKGTLEPTAVPPLPDLDPVSGPADETKKNKKGKASAATMTPSRPPPQPILNDADRAELAATTSIAVLNRNTLSATLSKTVSDLMSPTTYIPDLNWVTRQGAGRDSSKSAGQEAKVKHPRNVAHAAMIARLEGTLIGLQAELKRWGDVLDEAERTEAESDQLEAKLEALRAQGTDGTAAPSAAVSSSEGKAATAPGSISAESLWAGEEEAWVLDELDDAAREQYLFALSVLRRGSGQGGDAASSSKSRQSGPGTPKGKGKRASGQSSVDAAGDSVIDELYDALQEAEFPIDQLRSSTHKLSQLTAVTERYVQAISLRLGDALKEITSDAPTAGLAADTSDPSTRSGTMAGTIRGLRTTSAAASSGLAGDQYERSGALPSDEPGRDLLRGIASGSSRPAGSARKSAAVPPTPRKSVGGIGGIESETASAATASDKSARRSTHASTSARPSSGPPVPASNATSTGPTATSAPAAPPSRLPRPTGAVSASKPTASISTANRAPSVGASSAAPPASPGRRPGTASKPSTPLRGAAATSTPSSPTKATGAPAASVATTGPSSPRKVARAASGTSSVPTSPSKASGTAASRPARKSTRS